MNDPIGERLPGARRRTHRPCAAWRALVRRGVVLVSSLPAVAAAARAQAPLPPATGTPGVPGEQRSVEGRVLRGGPGAPQPVAGQYVVLHRISSDSAGPLDSVRTGANGQYRFRYRLESTSAMYIVSSRYAGVAYFTSPLRAAAVTGSDAELLVYDTTSRTFPLTVRGRHFVVSPPEADGFRRVVDVFEVANDSTRTLVAGDALEGTWRVRIPGGVRDPRSSGGDLPPDALRLSDGYAVMDAPFAPGSRQIVLSYGIPPGVPVDVPVEDATGTLEVLVEGAGANVSGARLAAEAPVTMEGRTFQRFVAGPVPAGSTFELEWSGGRFAGGAGRVALLALAAGALASGIVLGRRSRPRSTVQTTAASIPPTEAASLARAIATLDEVYAASSLQDDASQATYREQRSAMKSRLVAALAVEEENDAL